MGIVKRGDLVAITAGLPLHEAGTTNLITVQSIE
jgi:pyruvate kinase